MLVTLDVLADARNARAQAADAAHQQVDLYARLRGVIEQPDHLRVHQRVHLENQMALAAGLADA